MPRYMSQRNGTDCGPTAVINALKWAGLDATFKKSGKKARELCKWEPNGGGCYTTNILNSLRVMSKGRLIITRYACTPKSVMDAISDGAAAFVMHRAYDNIGHITFTTGIDNPWVPFMMVNAQLRKDGPTCIRLTERRFRHLLRKHTTEAYIITRK